MTPAKYDLGDYKEVSERIIDFRQKYPDGSLQSEVILWPADGLAFIAVKAYAYRSKHDEHPGIGLAWEPFPGKTPYTRDSELQNAETSAWGRAIVAALASDTKQGIASADEVRARREDASVGAGPKATGEAAGSPASTSSPVQGRGQTAAGEGAYGVTLDERRSPSAPAAVTNRVGAPLAGSRAGNANPSGTGHTVPDSQRSGEPRGNTLSASPPAASTNPAGDPSPPRVEAPASPGDGQRTTAEIHPSPGTTFATDQQWAKALTMFGTKPAVLKAHAAKFSKSVKAADITEGEMAELLL